MKRCGIYGCIVNVDIVCGKADKGEGESNGDYEECEGEVFFHVINPFRYINYTTPQKACQRTNSRKTQKT